MTEQMGLDEATSLLRQLTRQYRALVRLEEVFNAIPAAREAAAEAERRKAAIVTEVEQAEKALLDLQAQVEACREHTQARIAELQVAFSRRRQEIEQDLRGAEASLQTKQAEVAEKVALAEQRHAERTAQLDAAFRKKSMDAAQELAALDKEIASKRGERAALTGELAGLRAQAQRIGRGE